MLYIHSYGHIHDGEGDFYIYANLRTYPSTQAVSWGWFPLLSQCPPCPPWRLIVRFPPLGSCFSSGPQVKHSQPVSLNFEFTQSGTLKKNYPNPWPVLNYADGREWPDFSVSLFHARCLAFLFEVNPSLRFTNNCLPKGFIWSRYRGAWILVKVQQASQSTCGYFDNVRWEDYFILLIYFLRRLF